MAHKSAEHCSVGYSARLHSLSCLILPTLSLRRFLNVGFGKLVMKSLRYRRDYVNMAIGIATLGREYQTDYYRRAFFDSANLRPRSYSSFLGYSTERNWCLASARHALHDFATKADANERPRFVPQTHLAQLDSPVRRISIARTCLLFRELVKPCENCPNSGRLQTSDPA